MKVANMEAFKRSKKYYVLFLALFVFLSYSISSGSEGSEQSRAIGMAVEFMDHAACAYVARDKGWFRQQGLHLSSYESYVTGMALAAALARGDIEVAYICLVPAINVFANAGVKIKIVAGTHKYGYGLVVNPYKIHNIQDLESPKIRLGCVREGGAVDVLLNKTIEEYHLDFRKILPRVQRMNPPKQVLAIKMGRLDAAFLPEQWATMAENCGFKMLLTARDIWPHMQGSVLVVKEELIKRHPGIVKELVRVTQKATTWINNNPNEAAIILARQLSILAHPILPAKIVQSIGELQITPKILRRSMSRLDYETTINAHDVQAVIDYMAKLGYIPNQFPADKLLDLRFLK